MQDKCIKVEVPQRMGQKDQHHQKRQRAQNVVLYSDAMSGLRIRLITKDVSMVRQKSFLCSPYSFLLIKIIFL